MGKVSIIIPTYNNAHFLPETLESIFNQDYGDYEVIVVDDGSNDNTRELIESYGDKIIYLYQENSGACSKPRNEGIKIATGEYICIFDSDDIMKPDKVRLQTEFLDTNPDVGFVFTDFRDFRGDDILSNHVSTCAIFNGLQKKKTGEFHYVINKVDCYETLLMENFIGASSMMFRRSLFNAFGPFDETLDSSEDIDFTLRVTRKSDLGFVDRVCHMRRLHGNSMSSKTEKVIARQIRVYCDQLSIGKSARSNKELIKKVASLYLSLCYYYRENSRFGEAVRSCISSIRTRKFPNRAYLSLVKTIAMSLRY